MYMSTRANLDYWSTDNCCLRWSLRTGAITIGLASLVWQSLMVMSGVMMIVQCPVNDTTIITTNTTNLTLVDDLSALSLVMGEAGEVAKVKEVVTGDKDVKCSVLRDVLVGGGGERVLDNDSTTSDAVDSLLDSSSSSNTSSNTSSIGELHISPNNSTSNNSSESDGNETLPYLVCPWLPDPEIEVLSVHTEEKLFLVAGIFIAYSGIYCILSLCVVVGSFTKSVTLLQGWVAFTGFHNMLILASLLVPLPFTTLTHLFLSIAYFILSLYTWAVVKSYMHALKVMLNKPLLPEGSITDYTVDGVDVSEIPVQV